MTRPSELTVISMHGARQHLRERITPKMQAKGWHLCHDTEAWHLSRAGAQVVRVFLDANLDSDPYFIELSRGVYEQPAPEPVAVKDLLSVSAGLQLERAFPEAAALLVTVATRPMAWKKLGGGQRYRARRWDDVALNNMSQPGAFILDEDQIIAYIEEVLAGSAPQFDDTSTPATDAEWKESV